MDEGWVGGLLGIVWEYGGNVRGAGGSRGLAPCLELRFEASGLHEIRVVVVCVCVCHHRVNAPMAWFRDACART